MKRIIASLILLAALFGVASPVSAITDLGGFEIERFDVTADVRADGIVHVEELIDVRFSSPRHGIFRTIPIDYTNASGNNFSLRYATLGVQQDGRSVPFDESRDGRDVVLKIGNPNWTVDGSVRYLIAYDVQRALLRKNATDELYWNVTGNEWPTVPKSVRSVVRLPAGVDAGRVERSCYTGAVGSTESDCQQSVSVENGQVVVTTTAHNFLTTAVRLPSGVVARPNVFQEIIWFIQDNGVVFLPFLVLFLLCAYWVKNGRDPATRAIVTEFSAPEGLTPAELGTLEDASVHDRDLSATIIDLAVRGYVKIIETQEKGVFGTTTDFTLERTGKTLDGLQKHETELIDGIFGPETSRSLSDLQVRARQMSASRHAAQEYLYRQMLERGWYVKNPQVIRNTFFFIGGVGFVGVFMAASDLSIATVVSLLVSFGLVGLFGIFMPKRTEAGTRLYERTLGFKTYLSKAEQYRLQWQEKERIFETFLPYAMVFGVVDKWTDALADVIRQPDWYQGPVPGVWNAHAFGSSMMSLNSSLNSAVMVSPQSAARGGSGIGGGHSGGGFGGGGGGSW